MSYLKDELRKLANNAKLINDGVGYPAYVFHLLTRPFEQGAWKCPNSVSGLGVQCQNELRDVQRRIEGRFSEAAADANSIYMRFPAEY